MSNTYEELAPTLSVLLTQEEIIAKKEEVAINTIVVESYQPILTKEVVDITLNYIRWMGASAIPWEHKKYYNNGPQDIVIKVCAETGNSNAITEDQVRTIYNEWKMIENLTIPEVAAE